MASLLSFYGCTGDDDDGGSSSSSGTAFSCALAEQAFNDGGSFEDMDLGSVEASCSNGIVTLSANTSSSETTGLTCDGVTFDASGESGNMTIDLSQTTISGESISGNAVYTLNLGADIGGTTVECQATITFDMSQMNDDEDEDDGTGGGDTPEGMDEMTCNVGGSTVTFADFTAAGGGCDNSEDYIANMAKFLEYYRYLSSFGENEGDD